MKADPKFLNKPEDFWACVRTLSEAMGYSKDGEMVVADLTKMVDSFTKRGLAAEALKTGDGKPTPLATELLDYLAYRSREGMENQHLWRQNYLITWPIGRACSQTRSKRT